ncbi:hypothetical protein VFPPC_14131 [Pochonia chlamydosporia 170]|uniref:Uncharacterized protein n=1 Tax=Pochonia chlamydosporia 170 TaxID=1380566 RepID=A0A179FAY7_METCM|nr:hypothetical protein VFPPC_14131 [Pochonia chlamydosporia 170]OAQ62451.1 hypothetical protein VFPPC_14131 [Pochonia chlamydosporia 170]
MAQLQRLLCVLAIVYRASAKPFPDIGTTIQPAPTQSQPPTITNCGTAIFPPVVVQQYEGLSTNSALQCQCLNSLNSWISDPNAPTRTLTRYIGTGLTTITSTVSGSATTITKAVIQTDIETVTDNFIVPATNLWYGSAKPPCCYSCTVAASTVDLFFWPQASETASVTSFVSNGFTYQSPSVYIGFSSLSAIDFCGQVGKAYVNTTVAFNPEELSTIAFSVVAAPPVTLSATFANGSTMFTTSTPTQFTATGSAPLNYRDLERNCSTISGYTFLPGNPSNAGNRTPDPCHPTIVLPDRIRSLDPAWVSCVANGIGGFYDPPSALSPVTAPPETTSQPPAVTTSLDNPSPGSSSDPTTPAATQILTDTPSPPLVTSQTTSADNPSPTGVNNNNNPPPASQSSGSPNGNGNGDIGGTSPPDGSNNGNVPPPATSADPGNGVSPSNGPETGNGDSPVSIVNPDGATASPSDATQSGVPQESSITVSRVTIITTSSAVGQDPDATGNLGPDASNGSVGSSTGGSLNGTSSGTPTVVRSGACPPTKGLMLATSLVAATLLIMFFN